MNNYHIVPYPNHLTTQQGEFVFNNSTKLLLSSNLDAASKKVAQQFANDLRVASSISFPIIEVGEEKLSHSSVAFMYQSELGHEAYKLVVTPKHVVIKASDAAGFFYGVQSLKQLLPLSIFTQKSVANEKWVLPCIKINDAPRFQYRGMLLDVGRHFFSVEEIKKYIDILSIHKINTFHWHLTEDQGWRIEIKRYPKLTQIGSIRKKTMIGKEWNTFDTTPYGGYYTQDQIRDIVAYASDRAITIIPEIDLPGHMMGALASYPELGCTGGPYDVSGQWGVRDDVLCVGKDSTFTFIENVLDEVLALFPSNYIHIGGDECPKVRWEQCPACQVKIKELGFKSDKKHKAEHYLQSYAISRVEKFLNSRGRQIIGWDEILEGGLAPNATVMSWRGMDGGIEAARQRHDVIMTPNSHVYFDHYQSLDYQQEPLSIGGYSNVERVYSLEPVPSALKGGKRKYVIGVQGNLWTEYIADNAHLEYQLLPRLAALSEVQWTKPENKKWTKFLERMDYATQLYGGMGYNFAKHIFDIEGQYLVNPKRECVEATLKTQGDRPIYYTLDGTGPSENSQLYTAPIQITKTSTLKAMVKRDNVKARVLTKEFSFNKVTGKKIELNTKPKDKYRFGGASVLVDGLRGDLNYASGRWIGYCDEPFDATIDFVTPTSISSVKMGVYVSKPEWIFPPTKYSIYVSTDGKHFTLAGEQIIPVALQKDKDGLKEYICKIDTQLVKKVRVVAQTTNPIPSWHGAKGLKGFVFIDELIVE